MLMGIVCVDNKWGIGKDNGLLFKLKKDMQFFKERTIKTICVMGYNTLLSLPNSKPLKDRVNVVMCPEGVNVEGCICFHNFDELVNFCQVMSKEFPVFVIGGGMLFNSMLPYYERVYVTKVLADGDATVFFPNLDRNKDFYMESCSKSVEDNGYKISFTIYQRKGLML